MKLGVCSSLKPGVQEHHLLGRWPNHLTLHWHRCKSVSGKTSLVTDTENETRLDRTVADEATVPSRRYYSRIMELSLLRTFAPGSESTMVWNFRSLELLFPGTFAPGAKVPRTFAPGSESSKNFRSKELSLPGTFAPGNESSKNFRSHPKWLSVATFVHGHVRIGLRRCVNLRPSFKVCFTKALL